MINIKDIKNDIVSFADDEDDVIFERDGNIVFTRHGEDIQFTLFEEDEKLFVSYNENKLPYKTFLAKEIAKLDLLANKILEKRNNLEIYIDPKSRLITSSKKIEGNAIELLQQECDESLLLGTKVTFVTADAGHGKTVLLKEYQVQQAKRYLKGKSNYLFWHIDLHGRDLVRLNEAIMYDLGDLRMSGLYESSIITLIKHHIIVLGIDGFDELAAEIGGENALGSLSSLVLKMEGKGNLVAASRRTFFNTQDFLKRTKLLRQKVSQDCDFNELKISNWAKPENIEYLGYHYKNPEEKYIDIMMELKSPSHPLLERPYLFTKVVSVLASDNIQASGLLKNASENLDSINGVIEAFIEREVSKWKERDKETGRPYLTFQQHLELLSAIAKEMWENQSDIISVEIIQFLLTILLDEWKIEDKIKPIAVNMVVSHALLLPVPGKDNHRKFEHIEFKNYFLSKSLAELISIAIKSNRLNPLKKFLYISQLPDSVARYYSETIDIMEKVKVISVLHQIVESEWKPSYLLPNVGTLIPYVMDGLKNENIVSINKKLTFSSLIFEGKELQNVIFKEGNFINISFKNTQLKNVFFEQCVFNEIGLYFESSNVFETVVFKNCEIKSSAQISNDSEKLTEYSPSIIKTSLIASGLSFEEDNIPVSQAIRIPKSENFVKCLKRVINKFNTTTYLYEVDILNEPHFNNTDTILNGVIPILEKYEIIEEKETKRTKQASSRAWRMTMKDIPDILIAENNESHPLNDFWVEVYNHK